MSSAVSIPVGSDSTTLSLSIIDDMIVEGIEDSVISISSVDIDVIAPDNVDRMNAQTTIFIEDNDGRYTNYFPNFNFCIIYLLTIIISLC